MIEFTRYDSFEELKRANSSGTPNEKALREYMEFLKLLKSAREANEKSRRTQEREKDRGTEEEAGSSSGY
jgi:hypothetical protein